MLLCESQNRILYLSSDSGCDSFAVSYLTELHTNCPSSTPITSCFKALSVMLFNSVAATAGKTCLEDKAH